MTIEEREKAIDALKISAPVMAVTQEEFNNYIQTLNNIIGWLEQEPKTGYCKDCRWWRDSDGVYRRGFGAESQCPISNHAVYCGEGYCYMFEPKTEKVNKMRDATPEERESVDKYVKSISKPTGVNFEALLEQEPKTGHWITTRTFMHDGEYYCDKCKCDAPNNEKWDYCPNCGCSMFEPRESEDKSDV